MKAPDVFYFIAQTGGYYQSPPAVSNYYVYMIPEFYRGQVLAEVEQAKLIDGALVYPTQFLKDLSTWDRKARRQNK
jgi:hypothetical protein